MVLSVITINYNNKLGLEKTISSVLAQKSMEFEFIIIDGASSDGSKEVILNAVDKIKIKYLIEPDKGLYYAMNKGVDMAIGDYCIFMNSGDVFFDENSISNSLCFIKEGKFDIYSGIGKTGKAIWYPIKENELSLSFFIIDNLNHQSTYIRTSLMKKLKYDVTYRIVADHDFFVRAIIMENASYTDIPVMVCECESAGASGDLMKSIEERKKAIMKILPPRMVRDYNFMAKYNKPIIKAFGRFISKPLFKKLYHILQSKNKRN